MEVNPTRPVISGVSTTVGPDASGLGQTHRPHIEGYDLTEPLGEGGMGVVWKGVQLSTQRQVAVKLMSAALFGSPRARLRFEREVELAARLEHPSIARVYDSGISSGVYFYAMELIEGVPLDRYAAKIASSKTAVIELMIRVAQGVQYAHEHSVIHRDLKPSNILVDAAGGPHILDFGLAKELLANASGLQMTLAGEVAGTPAYMSPEQASLSDKPLNTRSDVYALGVILYQLLCGRLPHHEAASRDKMLRRIATIEPPSPRKFNPKVDRELETVMLKALALEPEARYANAGEFARDLHNYLSGSPLLARKPTAGYLIRKMVWKHRLPVLVTAAVLAVIAGLSWDNRRRVLRERDAAVAARQVAEEQKIIAEAARGQAQSQTVVAQTAQRDATQRLIESLLSQGDSLLALGQYAAATERFHEAKALSARGDGRDVKGAELALWAAWRAAPGPVASMGSAVSAFTLLDERFLVTAPHNTELWLYDMATGRTQQFGRRPAPATLAGIVAPSQEHWRYKFCTTLLTSPDGRFVLAGGANGVVSRWEPRPWSVDPAALWPAATNLAGETQGVGLHPDIAYVSSISPDGRLGLAWDPRHAVVWDLVENRRIAEAAILDTRVAFDADERAVVIVGEADPRMVSWDDGRVLRPLPPMAFGTVISSDGKRAVECSKTDGLYRIREVQTGNVLATLQGADLGQANFSADGRFVFTVDNAKLRLRVWDAAGGRLVRELAMNDGNLGPPQVTPDGRVLAAKRVDVVDLWRFSPDREIDALTVDAEAVVFTDDSRRLLAVGGGRVRTLDAESGMEISRWAWSAASPLAFAPDLRSLAWADASGSIHLGDTLTGEQRTVYERQGVRVPVMAFAPDGKTLMWGEQGQEGVLALLDLETGQVRRWVFDSWSSVTGLAPTKDKDILLVTGYLKYDDNAPSVLTLNTTTGELLEAKAVKGVQVSVKHDSGPLIMASGNSLAGLEIQADSKPVLGRETFRLPMDAQGAVLAVSPDGAIAAMATGNVLRFIDVDRGREIRRVVLAGPVQGGMAFSPDGRWLAVGGSPMRLCDLTFPQRQSDLRPAVDAAFHKLGNRNSDDKVEIDPNDADALAVLARWYAINGLDHWALSLGEEALARGATLPAALLARGYWRLGRWEQAAVWAEKAVAQAGDQAEREHWTACLRAIKAGPPPEQ